MLGSKENLKNGLLNYMKILFAEDSVCIFCGCEMIPNEQSICDRCAKKLIEPKNIKKLVNANEYIDDICVSYLYSEEVASGIIRMKYRNQPYLAEKLADLLSFDKSWNIDAVAAVPMHRSKLLKRGYNQSCLLAERFCKNNDLLFEPNMLTKVRKTDQQAGADRGKRLAMQANTFAADEKLCSGKSILIVDDVCTTGSTVNECAKVLKEKGAKAVYVTVLAHDKI